MSDRFDLGVVIVTFDGADVIVDCLESLIASAEADGKHLSVVVVDNASRDGTVAVVEDWKSGQTPYAPPDGMPMSLAAVTKPVVGHRIEIVEMPFNKGFAGGVNTGLAHLAEDPSLDRFWVLNPDSVVPPGSVAAFAEAAPGAFSLMGGRVLYYDRPHMVQIDGGTVNRRTGVTSNANLFANAADCTPPAAGDIDFITGASMVVSRQFWETVGPMREDYFLYYEESDWALRRGDLPLAICPEAVVYHKAGSSIGSPAYGRPATAFSQYFKHRARMRFMRQHFRAGLLTAWVYTVAKAAQLRLKGYPEEARAIWQGAAGHAPPRAAEARLSPETLQFIYDIDTVGHAPSITARV